MDAFRFTAKFLIAVTALFGMLVLTSSASAQDPQVRFITYNVDFNNTAQQVDADIQLLKPEADIMMFQEAKAVSIADSFGSLFTVYHVATQGDAKAGSALAMRKSVVSQVLATGLELGVDNHGEEMLDRYIAWADVRLTNSLTLRIMSLHMPPGRFQYLQPIMADNLVAFVAQTPYPVVVGADWNYTVTNDPYNIQDRTGFTPKGVGIDGFYFTPQAAAFDSIAALTALNTNSGHDAVRMILDMHIPTTYIIDNAYGGFTASSNWQTGTSATDKYGIDYRFKNQGTGLFAKFTPNIFTAGKYDVYERHPQGANRTQSAPHHITYSGASDVVTMNQETDGGAWNLIGGFNFAAGTTGYVRISDQIPEAGTEVVMADAIRFVYRGAATAPAAPQSLTATAAGSSQVNLTWANALNETGYVVARSTITGGPYTDIATLAANATSYSNTGLTANTRYYYVVRATNATGASTSAQATAMTLPQAGISEWGAY